jgi:hypothetical protein
MNEPASDFQPLALTSVSWDTLNKVSQDTLDILPTRGLDRLGIKLDEPAAYLATLSFDTEPLKQLRSCVLTGTTADHVSASFIGTCDPSELTRYVRLSILPIAKTKSGAYLTILTGTMSEWYRAILITGSVDVPLSIRNIFTVIYHSFSRTLFKEFFVTLKVVEHTDGTILIRS